MLEEKWVTLDIKGHSVLISEVDYDWVTANKWRVDKKGYVVRGKRIRRKYKLLRLHREVMKQTGQLRTDGTTYVVDHINHNKLDNRRSNLRVCTQDQNTRNRRKQGGKYSSKYKGVQRTRDGRWKVHVNLEKKKLYIGTFPTERMAAHYYNLAAIQLHGEYAELNKL